MVRIKVGEKRKYIVPLRKEWLKVPRWRRSKRAVDALQNYITKHTKVHNVRISNWLNQEIWKHGGKNPLSKVEVEVKIENRKVQDKKTKKDNNVPFAIVELATLSERAKRLTKRREDKLKKLNAAQKTESTAKIEGKDTSKLAEELKKKISEKVKKAPKEESKKKSIKELSEELQEEKKKATPRITKQQERTMHNV
jgi:large subunit ribosomal protein L31e